MKSNLSRKKKEKCLGYMFYLTPTVKAYCMAHPTQHPTSFTSSEEGWSLWEKELPSSVSLCLEKRKTSETIHCALQGPSAAALLSGHVHPMGIVLFVIEFKPSHPKRLSFGGIFR